MHGRPRRNECTATAISHEIADGKRAQLRRARRAQASPGWAGMPSAGSEVPASRPELRTYLVVPA